MRSPSAPFAGRMPLHEITANPTQPDSMRVDSSANNSARACPPIAVETSRSSLMYGNAVVTAASIIGTRPANRSFMACIPATGSAAHFPLLGAVVIRPPPCCVLIFDHA